MTHTSTTALIRPESLDHAQIGQALDAQFHRHVDRHQSILIDFSGLATIGSAGTRRLVQWLCLAAKRNITIAATNVAPTLQALFDLTSLSQVLPVTTATAVSSRQAA